MPSFAAGGLAVSAISAISGKKESDQSQDLQAQQLALERERDAYNREVIDETNQYARDERTDILARRNRSREMLDPIQQGLVDRANAGPDFEGAYGRSDADVAQAYGMQREQAQRRRDRYGINPASGVSEAEERRVGNSEALARVGGRNRAYLQEDDRDWARKIAAYGTGNTETSGAINLQQLGVSGQTPILGQMSRSAGQNAAAAYGLSGKLFSDSMDRYSNRPITSPSSPSSTYYDPGLSGTEGSF